jgi:hypothetical protein
MWSSFGELLRLPSEALPGCPVCTENLNPGIVVMKSAEASVTGWR